MLKITVKVCAFGGKIYHHRMLKLGIKMVQNHLKTCPKMSLCGFEPQLTNLEFIVYPPKLKKSKGHKSPKYA